MAPGEFTIGDDLAFQANNVKSGKSGALLPSATLTFEFVDIRSRAIIASGTMTRYDAITASFEGLIDASSLPLFNGTVGIKPGQVCALRAIISYGGIRTTKAAILRAVLDPENER